jgi:GNAT superfamily N-acetyltransferase
VPETRVTYRTSTAGLPASSFAGFFEGWPNAPSPETLLELLSNSYSVVVAVEGDYPIGFANAISDGVLTAFIPLLEVRADYRRQGIGRRLIETLIESLDGIYAVDLSCDEALVPFYERLGFQRGVAMLRRDYDARGL